MSWQLDFISPCRHRGSVLWVWWHWCSEGCTESWTQLLHRSHAYQSNPGFSHVSTLLLNGVVLTWVLILITLSNCEQINLIAPPRYVMTTTTLERTEGLSVLNQAMAAIKEKIEEKRGVFNIQMEVNDINTVQIRFLVFNISTAQHKMCSEFLV